jgi:hypothetical protein
MADALDTAGKFFEAYRSVWLETRDGQRIANFYHAPCLTLRGDGSFVWLEDHDKAAQFFHTVADTYYRQGWEKIEFRDLAAEPLGSRSILATTTWQASNSAGALLKKWRQSYNLCRFGETWLIVLATIHTSD